MKKTRDQIQGEKISRRQFLIRGGWSLASLSLLGSCVFRPPTEPSCGWKPSRGERYVLRNARLVDVDAGEIRDGAAVLICDGAIKEVFPAGAEIPADIPTIDCRGCYLIPGLIDAHCHLNMISTTNFRVADFAVVRRQMFRNYEDCIAWGITTARDLGCAPTILPKDRASIERGAILGPHILTSLAFVSAPGGYPDYVAETSSVALMALGYPVRFADTPEKARAQVRELHEAGADVIKIALDHQSVMYGCGALRELSDAQLAAIKDEAAKRSLPVAAHHLFARGLERGLQFGIDTMEHVPTDVEISDELLRRVVDTRTPLTPTLTSRINLSFPSEGDPFAEEPELQNALCWRRDCLTPEIGVHAEAEIEAKCAELRRYYQEGRYAQPEGGDRLSFNPAMFTRGVVLGTRNLRRLIAAGAVIGAGNDGGVPFTFPGMLHHELFLLTQAGMSNHQALRAATLVNARMLRIENKAGSIEKGKRADLVLLADNPLEDIRHTAKVRAVFKQGRPVAGDEAMSLAPA